MQQMPTWAASSSFLRVGGRSGGAAACATQASRTGGRQESAIAQIVPDAPTMLAEQPAPAMIWPTISQRWQRSGTGTPMGERTPETVTASSHIKAAWRCSLCGHRWSASVNNRTQGTGCPKRACEACRIPQKRQPSISNDVPHLPAEWDWEANERHGRHPDQLTLGMHKNVQWVVQDECKLGLVHKWQATPNARIYLYHGSLFPSGMAVSACNSLTVQCPEAASLWDFTSNGGLTTSDVAVQSKPNHGLEGSIWQAVAAGGV